jgi:hypothetical protein
MSSHEENPAVTTQVCSGVGDAADRQRRLFMTRRPAIAVAWSTPRRIEPAGESDE